MTPKRLTSFISYLIALFAALVMLEFCARAFYAFKGVPFWETTDNIENIYNYHHPYLPVVLKKNSYLKQYNIFINNTGFRGPDIDIPKQRGTIRIAALGGSTTWGAGVSDNDCWPRVLENILRTHYPGRKIEVINAGIPGYNSMEDLLNLIMRIIPLEPDIVLIYQGYNDMKCGARATTFEPDYSDWRKRTAGMERFRKMMICHSRTLYALNSLASRITANRFNASKKDFRDRGQTAFFRENIFNIIALCKAHNIIPIISTVNLAINSDYIYKESSLDIRPSEFRKIMEAYNDQLRSVSKSCNVELVDAEKMLPDDKSIHSDITHFNVEGNRRLASLFAAEVIKLLKKNRNNRDSA